MWKESLSAWPPGFFGASEISASSVEQDEKSSGKLFTVLALMSDRVVGFCRTSPYGGEPDASYVDIINVVPDMHGRGIGKALLLDSVSRSVKYGMKRIDLHTWPANMKAVPLYKKTGYFWVPETNVYMQNYMPFLLGRKEFLDFLEGEDWYKCFKRALLVEQDVEKTASGRKIFRYVFSRNGKAFVAEFDRSGRMLSRMEYPGFSAGLTVDSGKEYLVGRSYKVTLSGSGFDTESIRLNCGSSIKCNKVSLDTASVEPLPVRVPKTPYEPADRLIVWIEDSNLELGIGVNGVEEVSLQSPLVRFLPPGAGELELDLKKLAPVSSVLLSYAVDDGKFCEKRITLASDIYQCHTVKLPQMEHGVHTLSIKLGETGYLETVVLIVGMYSGEPVILDTRKAAVRVGSDVVLTVARKGASTSMWSRGEGDRPRKLGRFFIDAGPPVVWNSDLPRQTYSLELDCDQVSARTSWPSRPGMTHWVRVRLDTAGYAEICAGVDNGSDVMQKVLFRADSGFSNEFLPRSDMIPLSEGLMVEPRVNNQVPDWEEDLSPLVSGLSAPWTGVTGPGISIMKYFPGWTELEYDMPGIPEADVAPGETFKSLPFYMLYSEGGMESLMHRASSLGWNTGNWTETIPFLRHSLEPVMASGTEVFLSHPLHGEREARIDVDSNKICSGMVRQGVFTSGKLTGTGLVDVSMSIAGRSTVMPVYVVKAGKMVDTGRNDSGCLFLANERVRALIDPSACGHVYSLKLDGVEYLLSSHPEPSEFAWEKPWFGGIHPRIMDRRENPYLLQNEMPEIEKYQRIVGGLTETGWRMTWLVDHKKYGSVRLNWSVGLVPGVSVLLTLLECTALSGAYLDGELDVRGFVQPGGSVKDGVLTSERFPGLVQGRDHAGAWADMGKWARAGRGKSFVEVYTGEEGIFFGEDYGKDGCHFCLFCGHDRRRTLRMTWLFGATEADEALSSVHRAHRR
jgi:ribosomal protein S18 acetylase RimI-like enzyme